MLSDLRFVQMAVARKDYVEDLCHLLIKNRVAVAYDGLLSMSTPIDIDIDVKPHAKTLLKALNACKDNESIALAKTKAGRLSVRCGKFTAYVNCLDDEKQMQQPMPEGAYVEPTPELLSSIKLCAPFMAIDASRPWAMGLRICGASTFATNNVILVEHWHGAKFPREVVIPADAVNALIRINQDPVLLQVCESSITFHYANDRWLRTQLVNSKWPEGLESVFNMDQPTMPIPAGIFDALEMLSAFAEGTGCVYVHRNKLSTSPAEDDGASVAITTGLSAGIFHIKQLQLLEGVATSLNLGAYPKPCPFRGKKIRGVILGMNS